MNYGPRALLGPERRITLLGCVEGSQCRVMRLPLNASNMVFSIMATVHNQHLDHSLTLIARWITPVTVPDLVRLQGV